MPDHDPDSQLTRYAEMLATAPLNLVSRRDRSRVRAMHVDDAVSIAEAVAFPANARCLDLGSGGGLPGIVIAIVRPDVQVTCLDARQKKMDFVRSAAKELGLANVAVVAARAETAAREAKMRESFDVVVSRAVGRLSVVAELGRGFTCPGGIIAAVKGPSHADEMDELHRSLAALDIERVDRQELPGDRATWVITMVAGHRLPSVIPRRDGIPQQSPLAGSPS